MILHNIFFFVKSNNSCSNFILNTVAIIFALFEGVNFKGFNILEIFGHFGLQVKFTKRSGNPT